MDVVIYRGNWVDCVPIVQRIGGETVNCRLLLSLVHLSPASSPTFETVKGEAEAEAEVNPPV